MALIVFLSVALPSQAWAKVAVGKVIISIGKATAVQADGSTRKLKRRSKIFEGDSIKTLGKSRLQIRFKDGQLIALKEETEFRIDEYKYSGKQDGTESASMILFKGGMRAITGAIGKKNKDSYKLKTPVATLGVRGTHYGLILCSANCGVDANGVPRKPGLYGGVVDGAVVLQNNNGKGGFGNDQYFFIADVDSDIVKVLVPPETIFGQEEAPLEGDNAEEVQGPTADGGDGAPVEEGGATETGGTTTEPAYNAGDEGNTSVVVVNPRFDPLVLAPPGGAVYIASVNTGASKNITGSFDTNKDSVLLGTEAGVSNLLAQAVIFDNTDCNPCIFDAGTATLSNASTDSRAGYSVNWGTWNGGYTVYENGSLTTTNGHFSFIYSPNVTATLPTSGTLYYYDAGSSPFYDQSGNAYSLSNASLDVNFGTQQVTSGSIDISGSKNYSMSVTPIGIAEALQGGINLSGTCSGTGCSMTTADGLLEGSFIGTNADAYMGSVGVTSGSDSVTGVIYLIGGGGG